MSRVLITGSADGLGRHAGRRLAAEGHDVVLHARNAERARDGAAAVPDAAGVIVGDLSSVRETREAAAQAADLGPFDAVIHNAGIGYREPRRVLTADGVELVFAVNVLAPYVLTALIEPPARLVYLSSGLHRGGEPDLADIGWERRRWNGSQAYSDSKLWDVVLAFAVARRWPDVCANAVEPGWIATRMGGRGAPGTLDEGVDTMCWLAVSDDAHARVSGRYVSERAERSHHPAADDAALGEALLVRCGELSGVAFPA